MRVELILLLVVAALVAAVVLGACGSTPGILVDSFNRINKAAADSAEAKVDYRRAEAAEKWVDVEVKQEELGALKDQREFQREEHELNMETIRALLPAKVIGLTALWLGLAVLVIVVSVRMGLWVARSFEKAATEKASQKAAFKATKTYAGWLKVEYRARKYVATDLETGGSVSWFIPAFPTYNGAVSARLLEVGSNAAALQHNYDNGFDNIIESFAQDCVAAS